MELKKIVVGIDFSEHSEVAAHEAVDIARHTGAEVVLVHVGTVIDTGIARAAEGTVEEWETIVKDQLSADRRALEDLRGRLAGQGADVSHMVIDGFPDTGLAQAAKELGAELVVSGSHGRTGIARWLLGSVAERTVRLTGASVLVARPGGDHSGGYKRLLVPTDFSDFSEKAIEMALVLAAPGAHVDLVHFWQLPMVAAGYEAPVAETAVGPMREALENEADRRGRELVAKYGGGNVEITYHAVQAGAAFGIVERTKEEGNRYDLIVMGSHGRRGFRRFILGSVAETVVRHAPCSVLVVHGGGK